MVRTPYGPPKVGAMFGEKTSCAPKKQIMRKRQIIISTHYSRRNSIKRRGGSGGEMWKGVAAAGYGGIVAPLGACPNFQRRRTASSLGCSMLTSNVPEQRGEIMGGKSTWGAGKRGNGGNGLARRGRGRRHAKTQILFQKSIIAETRIIYQKDKCVFCFGGVEREGDL
jgi:hypothetical protein